MTSIRDLIEVGDGHSLAQRYHDRYCDFVEPSVFADISRIVTDPNASPLGGTPESQWSDETWLNWLRNRVKDLESGTIYDLRSRLVLAPVTLLDSGERWYEFLSEYSRLAKIVAKIEGWGTVEANWLGFPAATEEELSLTESRLDVVFPASVRAFFLTTNGWQADGWIHPPIDGLNELKWLRDSDPHLYLHALQSEMTPGPFQRDPDGERLSEFRFEFGTRVARALALNGDTNDTGTALLDPFTDQDEWSCGVWAHWHTESPWSFDSLSSYMHSRYDFLVGIERDA